METSRAEAEPAASRHGFHAFWLAEKTVIDVGTWGEGKMPKSGPNTIQLRSRPLRFGLGFRWCFVNLISGGAAHKILIAYHQEKRNFCAYLFKSVGSDNLLLARLENHGTHPGVHLHACCRKTDGGAIGRTGYPEIVRIPSSRANHRSNRFPSTGDDALDLTGLHFNIPALRCKKSQLELPYDER